MIILFWILGFIAIVTLLIYLRYFLPLRKNEDGFEYVSVEDDGIVRELSREEQGYLKEKFHPTDGARPYIKSRYNSKTPDGKIGGYIERKRVPQRIEIIEQKMDKETWRRNWLFMLKDLTNLEYQKQTWLNPKNTNPYYSFVEFMCSYFDDLNLTDGYKRLIESNFVSTQEYESIEKWHKLLAGYNSPQNEDYDNQAVLNDEKWLEILDLGKESIENLKPKLNSIERSLLI
ncbi:hypothetical protein ATE84_3617 [Aquimarina sp. MAR_2010_214]|uniref:hypothetical protein n=1 Tax=Aquimarina sp. MAR_2010_214 TaxID=1250026 RepID=UPI000C703F91|nr:hypothetical protein [Aquimarina sp. MAR_2010_214]PKV51532.1 hypothetical protein ATE84_3617 [Aquimarina sp. MAR_2010_214]